MKESLKRLETASDHEDAAQVAALADELNEAVRQHMLDEETQIQELLLKTYGKSGAKWATRVLCQHAPICHLLNEIKATAPYSYEMVESKTAHLERILDDHCLLEEKDIFPWAEATYKKAGHPAVHGLDEMRWEK